MLEAMSGPLDQSPPPVDPEQALRPTLKNQVLVVLGILALAAGSFYLALVVLSRVDHIFFPGNEIGIDLPGIDNGGDSLGGRRINILVLGLDRRPSEGNVPARTDTMFVLTIDPQAGSARSLAMPRDLWVEIPTPGGARVDCSALPESPQCERINAAYVFGETRDYPGGGVGTAKKTVENLLEIKIDHYVIIDFEAFKKVIDQIGGIDVDVPEPGVNDPEYSDTERPGDYFPCVFPAGFYHMDGKQALCYARVRRNSDDRDRIIRQQNIILSVVDKASRLNILSNPKAMLDLWKQYKSTIQTDISDFQAPGFAALATKIDLNKMAPMSLGPATTPYTTRSGAQVLKYSKDGVRQIVASFLSDARLDEEAAFVEVQNGTGRDGDAQRAVDLFTSLGIAKNKLHPTNADAPYQKTQIITFTGKTYTAKKLAGWLGLSEDDIRPAGDLDASLRSSEADIVVIIGSDVNLENAATQPR
jgi:polyisoprenyl-teichoic acid--peptidoglycan teichoic acid transferase